MHWKCYYKYQVFINWVVISIDYLKCFDRIEHIALTGALKFFNFGDNVIRWTQILYRNSMSKVINNGHCSEPIYLSRGVKQGAPCSSYFFLICAEILAILLRSHKHIEGFNIGEFKKLFGQYADDMDIYCKNSKKNLEYLDHLLSNFCKNTGLKINYDKTTVYRIGSLKEAKSRNLHHQRYAS